MSRDFIPARRLGKSCKNKLMLRKAIDHDFRILDLRGKDVTQIINQDIKDGRFEMEYGSLLIDLRVPAPPHEP